MSGFDRAYLFIGFLLLCVILLIIQGDIRGLETRVNLLEARIHWQEEPPK